MDMITLALAKAYSDSKGGYTEKKTVTVNPDGEWIAIADGMCQKVSEPVDLNTLSAIRVYFGSLEATITMPNEHIVIATEDIGFQTCCYVHVVDGVKRAEYFIISISTENYEIPVGVYAAKDVISATFETIHPIDPKYLPGVCLPVVELSYEQFNEILEAEGTGGVTYGEGKVFEELEAAFSIGLPCVIRVPVVDAAVASIMSLSLIETDDEAFFVYRGNITGFSLSAGRVVTQDRVHWVLYSGEGA